MLQIHATLVVCMIPKAKRIVSREGTACTCVAPRTSGLGCGGFTAAAKSQQDRQTAPRVMRQLAASDHEKGSSTGPSSLRNARRGRRLLVTRLYPCGLSADGCRRLSVLHIIAPCTPKVTSKRRDRRVWGP